MTSLGEVYADAHLRSGELDAEVAEVTRNLERTGVRWDEIATITGSVTFDLTAADKQITAAAARWQKQLNIQAVVNIDTARADAQMTEASATWDEQANVSGDVDLHTEAATAHLIADAATWDTIVGSVSGAVRIDTSTATSRVAALGAVLSTATGDQTVSIIPDVNEAGFIADLAVIGELAETTGIEIPVGIDRNPAEAALADLVGELATIGDEITIPVNFDPSGLSAVGETVVAEAAVLGDEIVVPASIDTTGVTAAAAQIVADVEAIDPPPVEIPAELSTIGLFNDVLFAKTELNRLLAEIKLSVGLGLDPTQAISEAAVVREFLSETLGEIIARGEFDGSRMLIEAGASVKAAQAIIDANPPHIDPFIVVDGKQVGGATPFTSGPALDTDSNRVEVSAVLNEASAVAVEGQLLALESPRKVRFSVDSTGLVDFGPPPVPVVFRVDSESVASVETDAEALRTQLGSSFSDISTRFILGGQPKTIEDAVDLRVLLDEAFSNLHADIAVDAPPEQLLADRAIIETIIQSLKETDIDLPLRLKPEVNESQAIETALKLQTLVDTLERDAVLNLFTELDPEAEARTALTVQRLRNEIARTLRPFDLDVDLITDGIVARAIEVDAEVTGVFRSPHAIAATLDGDAAIAGLAPLFAEIDAATNLYRAHIKAGVDEDPDLVSRIAGLLGNIQTTIDGVHLTAPDIDTSAVEAHLGNLESRVSRLGVQLPNTADENVQVFDADASSARLTEAVAKLKAIREEGALRIKVGLDTSDLIRDAAIAETIVKQELHDININVGADATAGIDPKLVASGVKDVGTTETLFKKATAAGVVDATDADLPGLIRDLKTFEPVIDDASTSTSRFTGSWSRLRSELRSAISDGDGVKASARRMKDAFEELGSAPGGGLLGLLTRPLTSSVSRPPKVDAPAVGLSDAPSVLGEIEAQAALVKQAAARHKLLLSMGLDSKEAFADLAAAELKLRSLAVPVVIEGRFDGSAAVGEATALFGATAAASKAAKAAGQSTNTGGLLDNTKKVLRDIDNEGLAFAQKFQKNLRSAFGGPGGTGGGGFFSTLGDAGKTFWRGLAAGGEAAFPVFQKVGSALLGLIGKFLLVGTVLSIAPLLAGVLGLAGGFVTLGAAVAGTALAGVALGTILNGPVLQELKNGVGQLKSAMADIFLPVAQNLQAQFQGPLIATLTQLATTVAPLVTNFIAPLADASLGFIQQLSGALNGSDLFAQFGQGIASTISLFGSFLEPFAKIGEQLTGPFFGALNSILTLVLQVGEAFGPAFGQFFTLISSIGSAVTPGFEAVGAAFESLFAHIDSFINSTGFQTISDFIATLIAQVGEFLGAAIDGFSEIAGTQEFADGLSQIGDLLQLLVDIAPAVGATLAGVFVVAGAAAQVLIGVVQFVGDVIFDFVIAIGKGLGFVADLIPGLDSVADRFRSGTDSIIEARNAFDDGINNLGEHSGDAAAGIDGVSGASESATQSLNGVADAATGADASFSKFGDTAANMAVIAEAGAGKMYNAYATAFDQIRDILDKEAALAAGPDLFDASKFLKIDLKQQVSLASTLKAPAKDKNSGSFKVGSYDKEAFKLVDPTVNADGSKNKTDAQAIKKAADGTATTLKESIALAAENIKQAGLQAAEVAKLRLLGDKELADAIESLTPALYKQIAAELKDPSQVAALQKELKDAAVESNKGVFDSMIAAMFEARDLETKRLSFLAKLVVVDPALAQILRKIPADQFQVVIDALGDKNGDPDFNNKKLKELEDKATALQTLYGQAVAADQATVAAGRKAAEQAGKIAPPVPAVKAPAKDIQVPRLRVAVKSDALFDATQPDGIAGVLSGASHVIGDIFGVDNKNYDKLVAEAAKRTAKLQTLLQKVKVDPTVQTEIDKLLNDTAKWVKKNADRPEDVKFDVTKWKNEQQGLIDDASRQLKNPKGGLIQFLGDEFNKTVGDSQRTNVTHEGQKFIQNFIDGAKRAATGDKTMQGLFDSMTEFLQLKLPGYDIKGWAKELEANAKKELAGVDLTAPDVAAPKVEKPVFGDTGFGAGGAAPPPVKPNNRLNVFDPRTATDIADLTARLVAGGATAEEAQAQTARYVQQLNLVAAGAPGAEEALKSLNNEIGRKFNVTLSGSDIVKKLQADLNNNPVSIKLNVFDPKTFEDVKGITDQLALLGTSDENSAKTVQAIAKAIDDVAAGVPGAQAALDKLTDFLNIQFKDVDWDTEIAKLQEDVDKAPPVTVDVSPAQPQGFVFGDTSFGAAGTAAAEAKDSGIKAIDDATAALQAAGGPSSALVSAAAQTGTAAKDAFTLNLNGDGGTLSIIDQLTTGIESPDVTAKFAAAGTAWSAALRTAFAATPLPAPGSALGTGGSAGGLSRGSDQPVPAAEAPAVPQLGSLVDQVIGGLSGPTVLARFALVSDGWTSSLAGGLISPTALFQFRLAAAVVTSTMALGLTASTQVVVDALVQVLALLSVQVAATAQTVGEIIAGSIGTGIIIGLVNSQPTVLATAQELADKIAIIMKAALGINSPSRVAIEMGGAVGEGLAIGLRSQSPLVESSARGLAAAATPPGVTADLRTLIDQYTSATVIPLPAALERDRETGKPLDIAVQVTTAAAAAPTRTNESPGSVAELAAAMERLRAAIEAAEFGDNRFEGDIVLKSETVPKQGREFINDISGRRHRKG